MRYLKGFFNKKSNRFTQSEIDNIEDIFFTYLDDNNYSYRRVNNIDSSHASVDINYYISTDHPYHNPMKDLFELSINIYSFIPDDNEYRNKMNSILDIIRRFKDRLLSFGYKSVIKDASAASYGSRITDSGRIICEYNMLITK